MRPSARAGLVPILIVGAMFLSLGACASPSTSQPVKSPAARPDCWQTADTQAQMSYCAGKQYRKAQHTLHDMTQRILDRYADDPVFIKAFKASQHAWDAYRKSMVEARFPHREERGYYGSVLGMCEALYRKTLTEARIKQISTWLQDLPEGEVCAGSVKASRDTQAVPARSTRRPAANDPSRCPTAP